MKPLELDKYEAYKQGRSAWNETIRLPYLDSDHPSKSDCVDVYVEQSEINQPHANIIFVPGGSPFTFCLMGFGVKELRDLAIFLNESADGLSYFEDHNTI